MLEKRWNILKSDEGKVSYLREVLGINPTLCSILVQRGIENYDQARNYFRPSLDMLHDPFLMKDMDKAVSRITLALQQKEKILVFGDYDVDGTTAVACMYRFLMEIYPEQRVEFYIPDRYKEGYGVSKMGIDFAAVNGISLIICLDCGIKSTELIGYASSLGIDFIVCDHHLPDIILPPAVAILNPKQPGCNYPYKELCGCGVGFKLIVALSLEFGIEQNRIQRYLELVAIAIAADIVPMTGENRIMAYFGLQLINTLPSPGIKSLIELGYIKKELSITNVVFVIAPRVNAAGRMDDGKKAVLLFIEDNPERAMEIARMLHSDNTERKEADSSITEEALAIIVEKEALGKRKS
ncbi:MAG TPA: DHH family phosphoesterase, partial [Ferruginibacter sp.]|nr:DHH family phosphoesterase [Ferruginibacter sp.]